MFPLFFLNLEFCSFPKSFFVEELGAGLEPEILGAGDPIVALTAGILIHRIP